MRILNESPCPVAPLMGRLEPGTHSMAVIVKATVKLVHEDVAQPADAQRLPHGDLFQDDDRTLELVYPSDFVYFKPRADIVLVGRCRTPGGEPLSACRAVFAVGDFRRVLAVIGPRYWRRRLGFSRMEDPEPFTEMPLTWANAFGGAGYADNPVGRGLEVNGAPLPTVEDPGALIDGPASRPAPAAPGPVHPEWRQRRRKLGRYDGRWLEERWPALPEDFDWSYFNAAPEQQQVDGFLRGDETVELENLHAGLPVLRTRLPGWRPRCFLADAPGDRRGALREVPAALDTLWIDADAGEAVMIWRGLTQVPSDRFPDLGDLVVSWERLEEEPRNADAVEALRQQLWRIELGEEEEPEEEPVTPGSPEAPPPDEARARLQAELGVDLAEREAAAEAQPPPDREQVREQMIAVGVPAEEIEAVLEMLDRETPVAGVAVEARVREAYRQGRALEEEDLTGLRLPGEALSGAVLRACLLADADLGTATLARSDLRGSVLTGARLQDATLDEAMLDGGDMSGADLRGCSLRGARLEAAAFSGADLRGADLSDATGTAVDFSEADLRGACLDGVRLEACDLVGARLDDALLRGAFPDCDFGAVVAEGTDFTGGDLNGARFGEQARLSGAVLAGVHAPGSQWEGADLRKADLRASQLSRADFTAADLSGAVLTLSRLREANLERCRLAGADLRQVDLFQAILEGADLSGADLTGANLYEAETLDAVLDNVRLEGAMLVNTKLER